jgi:hypothetical protein
MIHRILAGAAALAVAAGSQAAISVSFAAGTANVERIFEISEAAPDFGGGSTSLITIAALDGVEVDLVVNMGGDVGLVTQRAGFEAMFYLETGVANGSTGVFGGPLNGGFRFFDPNNESDTLLVGFVGNGVGFFALSGPPAANGGEGPGFIAGSLLGPNTSYFLDDPVNGSALGFPGGGVMGDSAFTLTNFETLVAAGTAGGPVARATGSFSGTLIPSTGTGVLAGLGMGFAAARRRR